MNSDPVHRKIAAFAREAERQGFAVEIDADEYVTAIRIERGIGYSRISGQFLFATRTGGFRSGYVMPDGYGHMKQVSTLQQAEIALVFYGMVA